jgi:SSS family solute:Na+ symporter
LNPLAERACFPQVFAPFYFTNGISTLPEYIERRFSPASRTFLAFTGPA